MKDSQTITFQEDLFDDHRNCYNGWSEDYVQLIVMEALKELEHTEERDKVIFTNYVHHRMLGSNSYSEVCYIETQDAGFFFVMRNMSDEINVVYSRWD